MDPSLPPCRPDVARLSADEREALADAWQSDGLRAHASVAAFGRLALELVAAGAPASLIAEAHRAALDSVRHARLCFGLASAYAGDRLSPPPFDFGRGVPVDVDLPRIAARAAVQRRSHGAGQAAQQRATASDPAVRDVLAALADDQARHAALASSTVAWAASVRGEPVREAVRRALADLDAAPVEPLAAAA